MEKEITIKLFDGTQIECELNGNCYITNQEITKDVLSDDNLILVTINGQEYHNMHCVNLWTPIDDKENIWFVIREKTKQELKDEEIQMKLEFLLLMQGVE